MLKTSCDTYIVHLQVITYYILGFKFILKSCMLPVGGQKSNKELTAELNVSLDL